MGNTGGGGVSFGEMLKALVLDELTAMTNDAYDLHGKPETAATGSILPTPSTVGATPGSAQNKPPKGHAFEVYSDEDDDSVDGVQDQGQDGRDIVMEQMKNFERETNSSNLTVMDWWMHNAGRYRHLAITARRIMAVRATSSEAERDFSIAG